MAGVHRTHPAGSREQMHKPAKITARSMDIVTQKRNDLKRCFEKAFPEVFAEGSVDFDALKRVLGEWVEPTKERFGLSWPGKVECLKIIQEPSIATLKPIKERSIEFDSTKNVFIEGDNLEVLKLLQKAYFRKIKLIYIDPPYNTGNEFIYPDKYAETLATYLAYTRQVDTDGHKLSTNTESAGRYHSRWLNMMYPRLYLARNLLCEDGVIFISIDDGEVAHLRKACDEIFGDDNFVANVVWQKKYTRANDARWFSDNHDHILVYAKSKDDLTLNGLQRTEDQLKSYSNPDNHPKGPWKATPLHAKSGTNTAPYTFMNGATWAPPRGTYRRFNNDSMRRMEEGGEIWFGSDGQQIPQRKSFLGEVKEGVTPTTLWTHQEAGHNHAANNDLKALGLPGTFDNPKPVRLIRLMLSLATNPSNEQIVLDFFAGSGTTAQAVLEQNHEDGGNRSFICVQLPEPIKGGREIDGQQYRTISEISIERIRRAVDRICIKRRSEPLLEGQSAGDLGMKVFGLDTSNFKIWDGDVEKDRNLAAQLSLHADHISENSTTDDILYELLLKAGFPLTTKVEKRELAGKEVFSIQEGNLLICLDKEITSELFDALAEAGARQIICLDEGFKGNDQLKANAVQTFKVRAQAEESEIVFRTV